MPSSDKQTTQTTTQQPYKNAQPLLNSVLSDALKQYNNTNPYDSVYTGSTVVPMSGYTTDAYQGINKNANWAANGKDGLNSQYRDIIKQGGYNDQQLGAINGMQNTLSGLGRNGLTDLQDRSVQAVRNDLGSMGQNGLTRTQDGVMRNLQSGLSSLGANGLSKLQDQSARNYQNIIKGGYDPTESGFQTVMDNAITDASNAVNLSAAAGGRYGSAVHQGNLANKTGNIAAQMRTNDFYNWQNRADNANSALASLGQTGIGNQQGYNSQIAGLAQTGIGNRQNTANQLAGLGQQGLSNQQSLQSGIFNAGQYGQQNMQNAYSGMKQPYTDKLGVGSAYEDLYNRQLNDKLRIWNDTQNAPLQQLQNYMGLANLGGQYSSQNVTSQQPGQNPFLTGLGVASTGVGLLGSLGFL